MWRTKSLIYPSIVFLLLAIFSTLAMSYHVNYAILQDVLEERVQGEAARVTQTIQKDLDKRVERLARFKDSWLVNSTWPPKVGMTPDTVEPSQMHTVQLNRKALTDLWKQLSELFPYWGVDFLLLMEGSGKIHRHLPQMFDPNQTLPAEMLADLRKQTAGGKHWVTAGPVGGRWSLLFFAPLQGGGEPAPQVVFGYRLSHVVVQLLRDHPDLPFVLVSEKGPLGLKRNIVRGNAIDSELVRQAIHHKKSNLAFDEQRPWNLYYTPVDVVGRTLCLVVPVSPKMAHETLSRSRMRMLYATIGSIVVLLLLGLIFNRMILAPLRELRGQASAMVRVCTDEKHRGELDENNHNEIDMLRQALDAASLKLSRHVASLTDAKALLEGLALKDPLTNLGNRRMFDEFLNRALMQYQRKNEKVAVIVLDLDQFRHANQAYGKRGGNQLLIEVGRRFMECLRGEDLVFRIGEDEFAAFLPECPDHEMVMKIARRLHGMLIEPYELSDGSHSLGVSIGMSIFPDSGEDVETLIKQAEKGLKRVKSEGGNDFHLT
ncbi:MAG: GGDEF domain-containing protein [Magnetococcales bacterium]|nr:GGDEF domain-containing protein [Magnetococcales bacterium]